MMALRTRAVGNSIKRGHSREGGNPGLGPCLRRGDDHLRLSWKGVATLPVLYAAGLSTVTCPGFFHESRSLPVMPWYCTVIMRGTDHSPFFAKRTLPTYVANSLLWMYCAIFAWSSEPTALMACSSTSIIA